MSALILPITTLGVGYMLSVSRIHLISPHPFPPLGEGIGVRDMGAEFAEEVGDPLSGSRGP